MNENKAGNMNYNNTKNNQLQPQTQPNIPVSSVRPTQLPNKSTNQNVPANLNNKIEQNSISQQIVPQTITQTLNQNMQNSQYNNNSQQPQIPPSPNKTIVNQSPQNLQNVQNLPQIPSQSQENTQQLNNPALTTTTINPSKQNEEIEPANNTTKKLLRKVFIILMFIGLIITAVAIYLLIDDNNKYQNYTITVADLVDYDKVEKSGLVYYSGNYKYKVNRKEYFYTPKELSQTMPSNIIQLKYNPENPNKVYEANMSRYFFIILFTGLGISFLSGIAVVAFTSSKTKEIITVQVIEQVNCVGGKRIYLDNININQEDETLKNEKYYVYFTNDTQKFALGNKLAFNIFKYGEAFTTENYKNRNARTIYEFKDDDFTIVNTKTVNK